TLRSPPTAHVLRPQVAADPFSGAPVRQETGRIPPPRPESPSYRFRIRSAPRELDPRGVSPLPRRKHGNRPRSAPRRQAPLSTSPWGSAPIEDYERLRRQSQRPPVTPEAELH